VVVEAGLAGTRVLGQRDPQLDAVQLRGARWRDLGVADAAAGRHQVELTRPDQLGEPQAVPVQNLAV
jgi:hypothetical protein